jgi:hypothetical protein
MVPEGGNLDHVHSYKKTGENYDYSATKETQCDLSTSTVTIKVLVFYSH